MTPFPDRLPPQNIDAELGALGAILTEPEWLDTVSMFLAPDDFYRGSHQVVYRAILELYRDGRTVDFLTVAEELTRRGELEAVGGNTFLREIHDATPNAADGGYYAGIVREKSVGRKLIDAANAVLHDAYSNRLTADELVAAAESRVYAVADDRPQGDTTELGAAVVGSLDRITTRAHTGQSVSGVGSPFFELDDMTTGFQPGQVTILAARPSAGKTALSLNIAEHAAADLDVPTLFVSLEMGQLEFSDRILSARSRIDGHKLRTGQNLDEREMRRLTNAAAELRDVPMLIDDSPTRTVMQVMATARRMKSRRGLGLVVVDYIQLVEPEGGRESRQEQVASISRRLKALARELKVPVLALSQLNRGVENREDKRPRMADLRESGAIEQDAHMVLLLHRPDYYDPNDRPGEAEVIVAKNRNGPTGTVRLSFVKNLTRFENFCPVVAAPELHRANAPAF